jgi:phosphotransferase system HPr (HPr) family protein
MIERDLVVKRAEGLHFRALVSIARIVSSQQCRVVFEKHDGEKAAAGSLLEMLALCALQGTILHATAEGVNAEKTIDLIGKIFDNGAGI